MPKFVILQRTRREHYNLVYAQSDRTTGKNIQFHNIAYLWSCRVIQAWGALPDCKGAMAYLGRARLMKYVSTDMHVAYSLSLLSVMTHFLWIKSYICPNCHCHSEKLRGSYIRHRIIRRHWQELLKASGLRSRYSPLGSAVEIKLWVAAARNSCFDSTNFVRSVDNGKFHT